MSKILIIDDDVDLLKLLRFKLSQNGHKVITAIDAYNGIQTARNEKPDLIILDIMLPAGGGLHTLKNIRLTPYGSQVPIVILTAINDKELQKQIEKQGVEAYLEKPVDYKLLSETINKLLML